VRLLIFWIPHRTLTHSVIALAAVGAAALMLGIFAVSFAAGYASHIAADMTTRNGVPLFYPLWGRRLHLLPPGFRLMTGGLIESLFATGCTVGIFVLIAQFLGVVTWTN
jgi:inner membrane protein